MAPRIKIGTSTKGTRRDGSRILGTKASQHDASDLSGAQFVNTVITEVDCGPWNPTVETGILPQAKELARRFSRVGHRPQSGSTQMSKHHVGNGEEIEMHAPCESAGVVVSYDVWRTVEEMGNAKVCKSDSPVKR